MKKHNKMEIGVGSVVKAKVGEFENITREGRSMRMRKEVVGCVQAVAGKKNFVIQLEDGQKKEISSSLLLFLSLKEEVEMDEAISHYSEKEQGKFLTIVGDPEVGEPCMFGKGMCLYVFYCLCCVKDVSTDISEDQVSEEKDPELNEDEDIRMDAIRGEHWRGVAEESDDKKKMHALRWEIYVK